MTAPKEYTSTNAYFTQPPASPSLGGPPRRTHILIDGRYKRTKIACNELAWGNASSRIEDATCLRCVKAELARARAARAAARKTISALLPVERRLSRKRRRKA